MFLQNGMSHHWQNYLWKDARWICWFYVSMQVCGEAPAKWVQRKDNVHRCTPNIPSIKLHLSGLSLSESVYWKRITLSFTASTITRFLSSIFWNLTLGKHSNPNTFMSGISWYFPVRKMGGNSMKIWFVLLI